MKTFVQVATAGLVGFLTLKVIGWLLLPILGFAIPVLGFATGVVAFLLKVAVVMLVGWLVLRLFRGKRTESVA